MTPTRLHQVGNRCRNLLQDNTNDGGHADDDGGEDVLSSAWLQLLLWRKQQYLVLKLHEQREAE